MVVRRANLAWRPGGLRGRLAFAQSPEPRFSTIMSPPHPHETVWTQTEPMRDQCTGKEELDHEQTEQPRSDTWNETGSG